MHADIWKRAEIMRANKGRLPQKIRARKPAILPEDEWIMAIYQAEKCQIPVMGRLVKPVSGKAAVR